MAGRKSDGCSAMDHVKGVWHDDQSAARFMRHRADGTFDLGIIMNLEPIGSTANNGAACSIARKYSRK